MQIPQDPYLGVQRWTSSSGVNTVALLRDIRQVTQSLCKSKFTFFRAEIISLVTLIPGQKFYGILPISWLSLCPLPLKWVGL